MSRASWTRWLLAAVFCWSALYFGALAVGSHAEPVLLAALVLAVDVALGMIGELSAATDEVDWTPPHRSRARSWGRDARFSRLAQSFSDGSDPQALAVRVHGDLSAVVDHRLASTYAVDRRTDPQAARGILGEQLADYLEQPVRHRRGEAARLSALLTRIEAL
ncbi:MAG: hypothetical protein H0U61_03800 [Nocardioidaceae bacterium]|nr:hypothetical protein [Nocardioidaceae bacterium]